METKEIQLSHGTLAEQDIDVLSGMMCVFMRAAEKCLQVIELHCAAEYRAGDEYKYYRKLYGKAVTEAIVQKKVREVIRGDKRNQLGRILKLAEDFHHCMDRLIDNTIQAHTEKSTDMECYDAFQHDANLMCLIYALLGNCTNQDDEIRLISTLRNWGKGKRVSETVLDKLKIQ